MRALIVVGKAVNRAITFGYALRHIPMAPVVLALYLMTIAPFSAFACGIKAAAGDTGSGSFIPETAFPLHAEQGKRYLLDASNRPFFMNGDTAWSLIADLDREDADLYLRDRKARGFNTILVNLLEHQFSRNAPNNVFGDKPFLTDGDYSTPNEAYFAHADWVLQRACDLGIAVLLTPSYVGNQGGAEGWYQEMVQSGPEKLENYGAYLGRRYRSLDNIIWVHGGDYNPPDKDLIRALVSGIRKEDPEALHTAHGSPGSPALEYWAGEPWLALNNVYTYEPVFTSAREQYERPEQMPFFLLESAYENEHDAGEHRVRMQAYQAILSGASGHVFGNNPIWHFRGPGIYSVYMTWQEALESRGAESMTLLRKLFSSVKWWLLEPDLDQTLLIEGQGIAKARAVAARASDGSFAIAYLPTSRDVTVNLGRLSGDRIAARWFDPSSGTVRTIDGSPFSPGMQTLRPPTRNQAGLTDWVLELTTDTNAGPI